MLPPRFMGKLLPLPIRWGEGRGEGVPVPPRFMEIPNLLPHADCDHEPNVRRRLLPRPFRRGEGRGEGSAVPPRFMERAGVRGPLFVLGSRRGVRLEEISRRAGTGTSAFTLIEIVISCAIMALILTSAYACFHAAISSRKLIEPRLEVLQNARVAMALISADLRSACPLSSDLDFLGMRRDLGGVEGDNLDFGTHNYTPRRPNEGDFCQVSYYLDQDPESGQYVLMRRRNPRLAPDPLSGGSREEIARGLRGLRFEYYDGLDWYDTWGDVEGRGKAQTSNRLRSNLSGLPDAVRITLWFDSTPQASKSVQTDQTNTAPPLVFQTVSRLNLAAASEKSASAGSSSDNGSDNSAQPPAGMANPGGTQ